MKKKIAYLKIMSACALNHIRLTLVQPFNCVNKIYFHILSICYVGDGVVGIELLLFSINYTYYMHTMETEQPDQIIHRKY